MQTEDDCLKIQTGQTDVGGEYGRVFPENEQWRAVRMRIVMCENCQEYQTGGHNKQVRGGEDGTRPGDKSGDDMKNPGKMAVRGNDVDKSGQFKI